MNHIDDENSLKDLLGVLWKRKYGMVTIFVCVVTIVTINTFAQTPVYEVFSSVMVRYGREYAYRPVEPVKKGVVQPLLSYDNSVIINTLVEIFKSTELIEDVLNKLGIETLFPDLVKNDSDNIDVMPIAIVLFRSKVAIKHVKMSKVIAIKFQHNEPEVAVKAVNMLVEGFKDRHLELFKNPRTQFLVKQVEEYRHKRLKAENALKTFQQVNNIYELKDQRFRLIQQLSTVEIIHIKEKAILDGLEKKVKSLQKEFENIPEDTVVWDSTAKEKSTHDASERLLTLQLRERELASKYTQDNRLLKAVRKDMKLIRQHLDNTEVSISNTGIVRTGKSIIFKHVETALVDTKVDIDDQRMKVETTAKEVERLDKRLQDLSASEVELKSLTLLAEATEDNYKSFVTKLQENRILDKMDNLKLVNIVVIEKPVAPLRPIKPNKRLNILIGMVLGAAAAVCYAVFFEYSTVYRSVAKNI